MSKLLDGELESQEAAKLSSYLHKNPEDLDWMESNSLLAQAAFEPAAQGDLSKTIAAVEAEIASHRKPQSKLIPFPPFLLKLSIAAAIAIVGTLAWLNFAPSESPLQESYARIEFVDTDIPNASPVVYTDEESGWNVVWVEQFSKPLNETS